MKEKYILSVLWNLLHIDLTKTFRKEKANSFLVFSVFELVLAGADVLYSSYTAKYTISERKQRKIRNDKLFFQQIAQFWNAEAAQILQILQKFEIRMEKIISTYYMFAE